MANNVEEQWLPCVPAWRNLPFLLDKFTEKRINLHLPCVCHFERKACLTTLCSLTEEEIDNLVNTVLWMVGLRLIMMGSGVCTVKQDIATWISKIASKWQSTQWIATGHKTSSLILIMLKDVTRKINLIKWWSLSNFFSQWFWKEVLIQSFLLFVPEK